MSLVNPPSIASGTVVLFADNNWTSTQWTIDTKNTLQNSPYRLPACINDNATWVAWNLPVGTFVTLSNDPFNSVETVRNSVTFDCLGTGKTETVDLRNVGINDCVSAYMWDTFNTDLGYIACYEDRYRGGARLLIFMDRYAPNTNYDISSWWFKSRISSIDWSQLGDIISFHFWQGNNKSGQCYNNAYGWNPNKYEADMDQLGQNDMFTSFTWNYLSPKREEYSAASFPVITSGDAKSTVVEETSGTNEFDQTITKTLTINKQDASSITTEVSNTVAYGWSVTVSVSYTPASETGGYGGSVSVTGHGDYSTTTSNTTTQSTSLDINVQDTFTIPAKCKFKISLSVQILELPAQTITVPVKRWYPSPVKNSEKDGTLWVRQEFVAVRLAGGVSSKNIIHTEYTPLA